MAIKVGCCGWPVAPAKYFEALGPVEIQESFYNLPPICRQLDLIHCVDPFQRRSVWGEPAYFHLHGKGGYHYRYSDAELEELRGFCRGPLT
ncbi:MAG: hypothetical protein AABZ20_02215 [candidate division NC10 bacterium]